VEGDKRFQDGVQHADEVWREEVESLRKEIDRLRSPSGWFAREELLTKLTAENERLRKERDALKAALKDIRDRVSPWNAAARARRAPGEAK
jgi:uncharacterized coiled-coil DUF342 family protein